MIHTTIVHAQSSHLELLVHLFDQYRLFYRRESDLQGARRFLADRLRLKDSVIFLALDENNSPLGFIQLYPSFSSVAMKRLWVLNDLFVDHSFRKQGVARRLLDRAVELARETKSKGLMLETAGDNIAARSLYEKLQWERENTFVVYNFNLERPETP